jgi:ribonuclease P protein component
MILFRQLFRFSQKEVCFSFDHIVDRRNYRGFKLLKAPLFRNDNSYGKLLVVTPRAAGKATERNRLRRQIKNIFFQEHCYQVPCTWIIIVYPKAKCVGFDAIKGFLVTTIKAPLVK